MGKKLSNFVSLQRGTTYKSALLGQPGPLLLGLASIARNGGFKSDNLKTYGGISDPRIVLGPGDIYVSLKDVTQSADLLGSVARVPKTIAQGRLTQDTVKLEFKQGAPQDYIYWLLQTPYYRAYCKAHATGTTNLGLSRDDFYSFEVPDLTTERSAIVATLEDLDDKIELNRRMNETLEQMAQIIFKDWFVDFGPVRRKQEGANDPIAIMGGIVQDATRAAELAALFPDAFGDNGLPEGWKERGLDEIAEFLNGLALQKFPAADEEDSLPVIKIAELRNGVTTKSNRASRAVPPQYVVKDGDFLFSWSGSLLAKFWTEGEGALNQHLFRVYSKSHPMWFVSQWVLFHLPAFQLIAQSKATTMGHIQRSHLRAATVVCPPKSAFALLDSIIAPLTALSINNSLESRTLAEARDYLLPKLMSGEVLVRDAEAQAARLLDA